MIVTSLFIGMVLASAAMLYHQLFLGGIVRRLIELGALSPEKALTVEQMGYSTKNPFVKYELRENSTFRKIVHGVTEEKTTKYYIPEEMRIRAEIRFRKKGNNLFGILLTVLVFLVVGYVSLTIVPWFADAIRNLFS